MDARHRASPLLVDALLLGAVGGLLVVVHVLVPDAVQRSLAFQHDLGRPVKMVTSAYLHNTVGHLWNNLLGYAAVGGYACVICNGLDERRWFWLTTVVFLTLLPVLVNLSSYALFASFYAGPPLPSSRGFSGVVAGYAGFLYVAALAMVRTAHGRVPARDVRLGLFALLAGEVLFVHSDGVPPVGTALVLALVGLAVVDLYWWAAPAGVPATREEWVDLLGAGVRVGLVAVVLGILVRGLFPPRMLVNGMFRDVFAHAGGLVFGAAIAAWGFRYWGTGTRSLFGRP